MGKEGRRPWCLYVSAVIGIIAVLFGLVLLIPFNTSIFPAVVRSQLPLTHNDDGTLSQATGYWQDLPVNNYYTFYFFNITNIDEVIFEFAKPALVEVGPYTYLESEFKEGIQWNDPASEVFYRNNKSWVFLPEKSCDGCGVDDVATLPNPAFMTMVHLVGQNDVSPILGVVLDLLMILTGEQPIRTVPIGGVLFDSYPDPLIEVLNSNLTTLIKAMCGGTLFGLPVPDIKNIGYFPKYNHTADENFLIKTGQADVDEVMQIKQWAGLDSIPWWSGRAASDHVGAGDGTFYKPFLTRKDKIKNFQSFTCRSFDMEYDSKDTVDGIDALVYRFTDDAYDTTKERNVGYRYENTERVDYFPSWPKCGSSHKYDPNLPRSVCASVDCKLGDNFCDNCCNGSHDVDTVYMPPGIIPLRCFPGLNKPLPFAAFLSPPHFSSSPPEVHETMLGLNPDDEKFAPAKWFINPTTGSTVRAIFQMQLSIPIYFTNDFTALTHLRNTMVPSFYTRIDAHMKDYAHDFVLLSSKTIPSIVLGVGIGILVLGLLGLGVVIFFFCQRGKKLDTVADFSEEAVVRRMETEARAQPATPLSVSTLPRGERQRTALPAAEAAVVEATPSEERVDLRWRSDTLKSEEQKEESEEGSRRHGESERQQESLNTSRSSSHAAPPITLPRLVT